MNGRRRLTLACGVATLLACAPLAPLFDSFRWLSLALLSVGVVTASALISRAVRIPAPLVPLVNLAALALLVSAAFGGKTHFFGVVPTSATAARIGDQINAAFTDIVQLAVPVPARRGLLLLIVLGVGLVAILVDALAVTLGRASLAGLPMLAMFAVPVAVVRDGLGWLPFAVAASGYLVLLLSEGRERASRWGRPFAGASSGQVWRPDPLEGAPMAAVGRRIGAVAIGFAVLLPALVPFIHTGGLGGIGGGDGNGPGAGTGAAQALNPITQLRGQLRRNQPVELLRVKTNDPEPFYLRVTTLDTFTRSGWQQDPFSSSKARRTASGLPRPGIGDSVPTQKISTQIDVRGLDDSQYLPVYAEPSKVDVRGDWRYDRPSGTVFSNRTNTRDLSYKFTSVTLDQSNPALVDLLKSAPDAAADLQTKYGLGEVPREPEIARRVANIVRGKTSAYDKTLAIYAYFRNPANGFTYTTSTEPGNSGSALVDFLDNKRGYCEQYASAMAAMARYAGVPARVAIGYTKGVQKRGYWSVTTNDAHAWVEIYFQNVGWVPWDPTPLSGVGRATALTYTSPPAPVGSTSPGASPVPGASSSLTAAQRQQRENLGLRGVGPDVDGAAVPPPPPPRDYTGWWLLVLGLGLVALVTPMSARVWLRRRRWRRVAADDPRAAAHAAWDEVLAVAHDLGLALDGAETPRLTAARLSRDGYLNRAAMADLSLLARAEERARYSRSQRPDADMPQAARRVVSALLAEAGRGQRLRARLMPASVTSAASRQSGLGAANLLNGIDAGLATVRRVVLGRVAPGRSG
ncbi:MAG: DUF3488 and transglutaminase-like domain-containing protein [Mycobacteriales bacterium]